MRTMIILVGMATALSMVRGPVAGSDVVQSFNPAAGEFPEGIALDAEGAMYVSFAPTGEIRRLGPDGSASTFFTFNPGSAGLGVLGLAADSRGTIYAAVPSNAPEAHGVWAITSDGVAMRLPGSEAILFPNGIARDERGTLYVSDSIGAAIWRIPAGGAAERWLEHGSLAGTGVLNGPSAPIGANGIAYDRSRLLVANTELKQVVEVPIEPSGEPGPPRVLHTFSGDLAFLDGLAVDVAGNAYVLVTGMNQLVQLDRAGSATVVATHVEDGLNVPASLAFGVHGVSKRTLHVTNFSLPPLVALVGSGPPAPGVLAVDVPLPGPPLTP